jgi:predicted nucleic acid-binding Zn ribbon protein
MSPRGGPRPLAAALGGVRERAQPVTLLAGAQGAWASVAGARVAAEAEPVAERDGVVTVACRSATWAQELDLLSPELLKRLNAALSGSGGASPDGPVRALRFTADHPPSAPGG